MPDAIVFHLMVLHTLLTVPHELGHVVVARLLGVEVSEFGIGLPPTLVSIRWKRTRFSLNLIPVGAFVGYLPNNTRGRSQRLASVIALGGPIANVLVSIACFVLLVSLNSATLTDLIQNSAHHLAMGLANPWGGDDIVSLVALTPGGEARYLGQWTNATDFLRLLFTASLVVGIVNLLPIPPLDGSKPMLGALRERGIKRNTERTIRRLGFVSLVALAAFGVILTVTVRG
jgi:Zn-dependent protease